MCDWFFFLMSVASRGLRRAPLGAVRAGRTTAPGVLPVREVRARAASTTRSGSTSPTTASTPLLGLRELRPVARRARRGRPCSRLSARAERREAVRVRGVERLLEQLEGLRAQVVLAPAQRGAPLDAQLLDLVRGSNAGCSSTSANRSRPVSSDSARKSPVRPKLLRPAKPPMSPAMFSTSVANCAELRAGGAARVSISATNEVMPSVFSVSASSPPRNASRMRDERHRVVRLHDHAQAVRQRVLADAVAQLARREAAPSRRSAPRSQRGEELRLAHAAVGVLAEQRDHGRALRHEILLRDALQVGLRRALHLVEVALLGVEPAGQELEVAVLLRLALHGLALVHLAREQVGARALELGLGRAEVAQAPHLLADRRQRGRRCSPASSSASTKNRPGSSGV